MNVTRKLPLPHWHSLQAIHWLQRSQEVANRFSQSIHLPFLWESLVLALLVVVFHSFLNKRAYPPKYAITINSEWGLLGTGAGTYLGTLRIEVYQLPHEKSLKMTTNTAGKSAYLASNGAFLFLKFFSQRKTQKYKGNFQKLHLMDLQNYWWSSDDVKRWNDRKAVSDRTIGHKKWALVMLRITSSSCLSLIFLLVTERMLNDKLVYCD